MMKFTLLSGTHCPDPSKTNTTISKGECFYSTVDWHAIDPKRFARGEFIADPAPPAPDTEPAAPADTSLIDVSDEWDIPSELDLVIRRKPSGFTRIFLNGEQVGKQLKSNDKINKTIVDLIQSHVES